MNWCYANMAVTPFLSGAPPPKNIFVVFTHFGAVFLNFRWKTNKDTMVRHTSGLKKNSRYEGKLWWTWSKCVQNVYMWLHAYHVDALCRKKSNIPQRCLDSLIIRSHGEAGTDQWINYSVHWYLLFTYCSIVIFSVLDELTFRCILIGCAKGTHLKRR